MLPLPPPARTTGTPTGPASPHQFTEPRPEFLEMVGRLAGAYCPPLLSTDVVEVSRSALAGRIGNDMGEVEAVARIALDAAVAKPGPAPTSETSSRERHPGTARSRLS